MSSLLLLLALQALPARAEDDAEACKLQPDGPEVITYVNQQPAYFARISGDGRYMFWIGNNGNYILDMNQQATMVHVPGPYDPVPAPPSGPDKKVRHFTVPRPELQFYSMDEALSHMEPGKTTEAASTLAPVTSVSSSGVYQSVGLVKETQGRATYRVLSGSISLRDFEEQRDGKFKEKTTSFNCDQGRYQLPMIAKDGSHVSVFDTTTGTTKILELKSNGTCEEALDLGVATGKVEFSYDGKAIAFHMDAYDRGTVGRQFQGPSIQGTKNVYVMNLDRVGGKLRAGEMKRITSNTQPGNNSYYPSFTMDGKVAYIHGEKDASGNVKFSMRKVDPKLTAAPEAAYVAPDAACKVGTAASFALGDLMQKICKGLVNDTQLAASDAATWALGMDPAACQKLVDKYWTSQQAAIKSNDDLLRANRFQEKELKALTKEAIAEVCPKAPPGGLPGRRHPVIHMPDQDPPDNSSTPEEFFERRCHSCHDGSSATNYEWDHLQLSDINKMLIALQNGTMPQGFLANREQAIQPLVQKLLERKQAEEERIGNEN